MEAEGILGAWSPFPRSGEDLGAGWGWGSAGEREACAGLVWKFCWRSCVRKRRLRATLRRIGDWDTRRRKPCCPRPRPSLLLHETGGIWLIRGAEPRAPGRGKIPGGPLLPACLPDAALQALPGPGLALDQEPGPAAALSAGPRGFRGEAGLRPSRVREDPLGAGRSRTEVGGAAPELPVAMPRAGPTASYQASPSRCSPGCAPAAPAQIPQSRRGKAPRRGHCNQLPPLSI